MNTANCYHGGAFFHAIGEEFDALERRHDIINADVLDAWFPPSPKVLAALTEDLPWLLRTSPPTNCDGMVRLIARARGVSPENILPAAGSSDAIYLAFRQWLKPSSRVLILDPTYGEYAHVLEKVIGCRVIRLPLLRQAGYRVNLDELQRLAKTGYDLIVLVNPNSPTGQHIDRADLEKVLWQVPASTLVWVDETYVDYAGRDQSLELFAAGSANVVVCKSMSKVYALSGARVAYLCGPEGLITELRRLTPPWAVSLTGQVAAVAALNDPEYYEARWAETRRLRHDFHQKLREVSGWEVISGAGNFLLCHLPIGGPTASEIADEAREHGLFLRDVGSMGKRFGMHAVRIAVKEDTVNKKIVEIIGHIIADNGQNGPGRRSRESLWPLNTLS